MFTNYGPHSDPHKGYGSPSFSAQETSSPDSGITSLIDEVILASENPKKRAGRKKFRETRHPVYRGVRRRDSGKWVCELREPNTRTRIWLGTFPTVEMAARAHDVAAIALRGRSACLNFADSAWRLPIPASSDTKDIQKTAVEAAQAFSPQLVEEEVETVETFDPPSSATEKDAAATNLFLPEIENAVFTDDEALFDMHGLVSSMAEGLMMPPPQYNDDVEMCDDVSLWNYSIWET